MKLLTAKIETKEQADLFKCVVRPALAVRMVTFAMAYTTVMECLRAFGHGPGADWHVLAAFVSQPLLYLIGRSAEKWKAAQA